MDPAVFGLVSAPPAGVFGAPAPSPASFGSPPGVFGLASSMGSGGGAFSHSSSGFGQPSTLGGASASAGPTFGSTAGTFGGASTFGALSSSPSPFGAPAPGVFGSPTPGVFGAPAPGGFGAPAFGGSSPFGAPRR